MEINRVMAEYERDPETGIRPISAWGSECARGFVSNARFSSTDTVIPRTNRATTRKWIRSGERAVPPVTGINR